MSAAPVHADNAVQAEYWNSGAMDRPSGSDAARFPTRPSPRRFTTCVPVPCAPTTDTARSAHPASFATARPSLGFRPWSQSRCAARVGGHGELKDSAAWRIRAGPQSSTMRFDDGSRNRQSHPQAVRFGGVKGFEDTLRILCWQPRPRILHRDEHVKPSTRATDQHFSRPIGNGAHRLHGVDDQIKDDLLEFNPVPRDERQTVGELRPHRNVVLHRFGTSELDDLSDCVIDVQPIRSRRRPFHKITDAANDIARSKAVLDDARDRSPRLLEIRRPRGQPAQGRPSIEYRSR